MNLFIHLIFATLSSMLINSASIKLLVFLFCLLESLQISPLPKVNTDLEYNFITNKTKNLKKNLIESSICFVIGLNSRYESSTLNTMIKSQVLSGNLKVISLSSSIDLTFPINFLGLNTKTLKQISEGNHKICQELSHSKVTFLISSSILNRKDSNSLINVLTKLKTKTKSFFNIINSSLNEAGINYLNNYKPITENDIKSNSGLYFLHQSAKNLNIKKLIDLKLLNYLPTTNLLPNFCIEQNNSVLNSDKNFFEPAFNIYNYVNLPNNSFFESNGDYLNTQGIVKKTIKFVSSNKQSKNDWQILRKVFYTEGKPAFLCRSSF